MAKKKTEGEENTNIESVTVKAKEEGRVGLWDTDPAHEAFDHENGEIFVKDEPMTVARTSAVNKALHDGNLEEVK